MKRERSNLGIYVLSGSIVFSSIILANQAQSAPQYVTQQQQKKAIVALVKEIASLDNRIQSLQECVNNLEVQLGGSGREVVCLP